MEINDLINLSQQDLSNLLEAQKKALDLLNVYEAEILQSVSRRELMDKRDEILDNILLILHLLKMLDNDN